jgi:DNA-binding response OmpR family regulator/DNA-binding CsgD family transcriptional regulator
MKNFDSTRGDVVLIVDDTPENLSFLHDALDDAGYTVLVATNGESALQLVQKGTPEVILLDAVMPGMDGFEVARRLKADFSTQHIPIVFMTGLTETEHVVAAFANGVADYVTKPIRPVEVLARIAAHMENARQIKQARTALDTYGQATVVVRESDGEMIWQTPGARKLLQEYFEAESELMQQTMRSWMEKARQAGEEGRDAPVFSVRESRRLLASLHSLAGHGHDGEWLVVLWEENHASVVAALVAAFSLTVREAEVLYWVIYGKTNRDIGDILQSSHRTVNKHLERVFEKMGVETRTAAAAVAMKKVRVSG